MNTAERIYVASTCNGESQARATEELARRIEDDIAAFGVSPGTSLGSLRELSERYRTGRSVVREAVALLERRGLGRLRPGPCGGFIVARPRADSIGAALADHFRAANVTPGHVQDLRDALGFMDSNEPTEAVSSLLAESLKHIEDARPVVAESDRRPAGSGTRAAAIAGQLAAEIRRSRASGTRLGTEWDLCERFNVSRLTLRQAIRLLQDSGLVECRRGRGNGLVVRDLQMAGAIRLVLAYFIGERLDPMAAGTALIQINAYVPALAVCRASAEQRRELDAALSRLEGCDVIERYDLLRLVQCVSRLADSPIIDLFSRCLAAYEARFRASLAERLPASAQTGYFRMVRALLDGTTAGSAALDWAKHRSAACMREMSRARPI